MRSRLALNHLFALPALLGLLACGGDDAGSGGAGAAGGGGSGGSGGAGDELLATLQAIEGLTVEEKTAAFDGYRFFVMTYEQPADHASPDGQRFIQRLTLQHRDAAAPMVLASTGYNIIPVFQGLSEPAELLQANQLLVEHRFFTPSRPDPAAWSHLTIEQAAGDHHRIVEAFSALYTGAWISTGASKGGMTSLYHRRFHPDDVDGTVAYVAPHSFGTSDPRYIDFVAQIGDPTCQQSLRDLQREVLLRRTEMLARMDAQAMDQGLTYDLLGQQQVLELAVAELVFTFWQYYDASFCPMVPNAASSDDDVWAFLDNVDPPSFWADDQVITYEPYFYQAAIQLGYPGLDETHLADLLMYPGFDVPSSFVVPGPGKETVFEPDAMLDVAGWVDASGRSLLMIYGENDPYTAAALELGNATDSYRFLAPGQNHGAKIEDLVPADRDAALGALEAWTGVTPVPPSGQKQQQPLQQIRRRYPL